MANRREIALLQYALIPMVTLLNKITLVKKIIKLYNIFIYCEHQRGLNVVLSNQ
ncbi:MAG: hypothetical protein Q8762_01515 [Pigeon pea little leaf phytoplasma]|uniref:Uncharacterized protein n=1 Tax=Candidatus Phytoplasma fabacearum TaxID=2982628 RepID=A0ABU8ZSK6_9MOLU|nr:hypothetical protein [Pigeon pea little leaf phytoplasma]MDV3158708.1 hypothetical protein [Pigeon pea little leaf phytoplasma]MDV3200333.1 hypothetical protein [Pigeon pea little leaf phytoplasma]